MNFYKNDQNAAILKRIKMPKNCHGRFTANYPNSFEVIQFMEKLDAILHLSFQRFERFKPFAL